MSTEDVTARLEDLRAWQERLLAEAQQQIETLAPPEAVPPGTVVAHLDEQGLLSGLALDQSARRRISPEKLATAIDHAVLTAPLPAESTRRAVGLATPSGTIDQRFDELVRTAARLTTALQSVTDGGLAHSPHVVTGTGVQAAASYGVVRSVTCDPRWLARNSDVDIAEQVVTICRRAALAADKDFGGEQA